jgi:hypothetical protein
MTSARFCPDHKQVLDEQWEGAICPDGHAYLSTDYRFGNKLEYWIVDMDLPFGHPRFRLARVIDGETTWQKWSSKTQDPEHGTKDYLIHPEHWAKRKGRNRRDMSFFERALAGRI